MTKRRLVIRPAARSEMDDAYVWHDQIREGFGLKFVDAMEALLDAIFENPQRYPVVHRNVRRAVHHRFPYVIYFLVNDTAIAVLAVFHTSRDPKIWKSRN